MRQYLKKCLKEILRRWGKRITNFHSPAKPYNDGVAFLKELITKPEWIIDVGAADGTPDLVASFPYCDYKYLLIEANPHFSDSLIAIQREYPDTVIIEPCFCGEKENVIPFHINRTGYTSSRYSKAGHKESVDVEVKTLDHLAEKYSIKGPIFLKIDVEGAELDVLSGASKTLEVCDVVILEAWINVTNKYASGDFSTLVAFMKGHSFVVFDFFGGHTLPNGVLKQVDLVFVKENSPYRKRV